MEFLAINILAGGAGWGIPVVLSDLTEACLFQRGKQAKDIIQMRFDTLEQVIWQLQVLYDSFWTGQCTGCWTLHASFTAKRFIVLLMFVCRHMPISGGCWMRQKSISHLQALTHLVVLQQMICLLFGRRQRQAIQMTMKAS